MTGMVFYGYIPLIAVAALTIPYVALPSPSVRSKCAVGCAALASAVAFPCLPKWRPLVVLLEVVIGVYLIFYFKSASKTV
jgi:hypothetical protein